MSQPSRIQAALVLLLGVLLSSTVLCAMGALSKTEILPILGGAVVVAHRLIDGAIRTKRDAIKERDKENRDSDEHDAGTGAVPLVGMLAGGVLATLATLPLW